MHGACKRRGSLIQGQGYLHTYRRVALGVRLFRRGSPRSRLGRWEAAPSRLAGTSCPHFCTDQVK